MPIGGCGASSDVSTLWRNSRHAVIWPRFSRLGDDGGCQDLELLMVRPTPTLTTASVRGVRLIYRGTKVELISPSSRLTRKSPTTGCQNSAGRLRSRRGCLRIRDELSVGNWQDVGSGYSSVWACHSPWLVPDGRGRWFRLGRRRGFAHAETRLRMRQHAWRLDCHRGRAEAAGI
jgi:hypothetical protein